MTTLTFWVNSEAKDQLTECDLSFIDCDDQLCFNYDCPDELIESMLPDDLIEFIGIDSEFLVNIAVA